MLRGDRLEQAFAAHDISANVTFGDDAQEVFLRVARGRVSLAIPPSLSANACSSSYSLPTPRWP